MSCVQEPSTGEGWSPVRVSLTDGGLDLVEAFPTRWQKRWVASVWPTGGDRRSYLDHNSSVLHPRDKCSDISARLFLFNLKINPDIVFLSWTGRSSATE